MGDTAESTLREEVSSESLLLRVLLTDTARWSFSICYFPKSIYPVKIPMTGISPSEWITSALYGLSKSHSVNLMRFFTHPIPAAIAIIAITLTKKLCEV